MNQLPGLPSSSPTERWWPVQPLRRHPARTLIAGVALALLVWLVWPSAPEAPPPSAASPWMGPVPVRVVTVQREALPLELAALGTVTPLNTVTVRSRVDGELTRVLFREGDRIEAGTLLAEIDPRPYQIALAEAEGQQQQNLALLRNAESKLELYRGLFAQDSIARQQLDDQEALVRQYRGTLQIDQARVDNARLQLSFTKITAPISGRLGLRRVDAGNLISAGDTEGLVVITQTDPIGVLFTLPEADLPRLLSRLRESDQPLQVEAYDREGSTLLATGELRALDNRIDSRTGTIQLKAMFANSDERLFPNQFVNVRLRLGLQADAAVLPADAVQYGSIGTYVYLVERSADGRETVRLRNVVTGARHHDNIAILEGLAPGDRVVLEGLDRLRDGAAIRIVSGDEGKSPVAGESGDGSGA
jgi:multidrug efflux system membrane fusion protein